MEYASEWIRAAVEGKSFAEVGGIWGTVNEQLTVAAKAGASEVSELDITPLGSVLWEQFQGRCAQEGVTSYKCISADINSPRIVSEVGTYDVVFCSGVIYHCFDPLHTVTNFARICRDTLILGSAVIPSTLSTRSGRLVLEPGSALFAPGINHVQRTIIGEYFREAGAQEMIGITSPCEWLTGNYAPWWWLFTSEYIAALLQVAGFRVKEIGQDWLGRTALYLTQRSETVESCQGVQND